VGERRVGKEKEKRKVDYYVFFLYSFSESLKNAMPQFFYYTPKKGKALFQTVDRKKLPRLKKKLPRLK